MFKSINDLFVNFVAKVVVRVQELQENNHSQLVVSTEPNEDQVSQLVGDLCQKIDVSSESENLVPEDCPAKNDQDLINLWIHADKQPGTQSGYLRSLDQFFEFISHRPLHEVKAIDIRDFANMIAADDEWSTSTQANTISAIRSLFYYGHDIGYFKYNVAERIHPPKRLSTKHERILTEEEVRAMLAAVESHPRNYVILRLLYYTGIRVSECCGLRWKDLRERTKGGGIITVYGKGKSGKKRQRSIVIPEHLWNDLMALRGNSSWETHVFQSETNRSAKTDGLTRSQINRIVKNAAKKAELKDAQYVSAHWLRHCHATHALENHNAPLSVVKQTLGHAFVGSTEKYLHLNPDKSSSEYFPE